jgi:hypothetical protein
MMFNELNSPIVEVITMVLVIDVVSVFEIESITTTKQ